MVLDEEKRNKLAEVIARRQRALDGAGGSAPAVPLPAAQDLPNPPPANKNKGVVVIDSEGEDTGEGIVFKRQRVVVAATSHSATDGRPPSFKDHPPSASSPRALLALEGGGESVPRGDQVSPAPELPVVLQHALKSSQEKEVTKTLGAHGPRTWGVPRQLPCLCEPGGGEDKGRTGGENEGRTRSPGLELCQSRNCSDPRAELPSPIREGYQETALRQGSGEPSAGGKNHAPVQQVHRAGGGN